MDFNWSNPYPTVHSPVMARNLVCTSHPLAAQAGLSMLYAGGNAVDAALAAAAALTIVEPVSNGLGSDNFAIVWDGERLHGLNSSGVAPAAWDRAYFARRHNGSIPERGWDSVTVPGAVAGWVALSDRFGKLPFADLLTPAIDLASRGYAVPPIVAHKWMAQAEILHLQPGFAEAFMPHGRAPQCGEHFRFAAAAQSLYDIAATRGESFYRGQIAERLCAHSSAHGGSMTAHDLAAYTPLWVEPLARDYAGYTVHELPPNGQGIAALIALGILGHLDITRYPVDSAAAQHLAIEAMKLAFADLYRWVGDERAMTEVTSRDLLDDGYLSGRARLVDEKRASTATHGLPPRGGTVYLTTADESGMMVSLIQSNYMGFGSGVVVPGTGISLQNRGLCFSLKEGHPNVVEPGKRPFQTIIPAFLTQAGKPQMSFGVMGGNMQPQGHVQTLLRMLNYAQQPQTACDAPRWKITAGFGLDCESSMPAAVLEGLRERGHRIESISDSYMDFGSGQFIWKLSDDPELGYVGASDSRRDGQAVGF